MYKFFSLLAMIALLAACNGKSEAVEAEVGDAVENADPAVSQATTYTVDPTQSQIGWTGSKIVGDKHTGTLSLTDGRLAVVGTELVGGEFNIDMNSLTVTDLDENSGKSKLEGHLKSPDFFDIAKHPDASFTLLQVQPVAGDANITHNLTGNLTLNGETKSVTIPAKVNISEEAIMATTPAFTINRTDWKANFGSSLIGTVGDKVISDEIELVINLKANRA